MYFCTLTINYHHNEANQTIYFTFGDAVDAVAGIDDGANNCCSGQHQYVCTDADCQW